MLPRAVLLAAVLSEPAMAQAEYKDDLVTLFGHTVLALNDIDKDG